MANTIREPKESVILCYPDIVVGVSRWVFVFSQFITSFEAASTACLQEAGSQSRTSKEINAVGCEKPIWSPFRWRQIFMVKLWTVCKCLSQSIYLLSRFWGCVGSKPRIYIANAIENLIKIDVPLRYLNPFCGHSCVAGIHSFAPPSQSIMRVCYKQPSASAPFILGLSPGTKFRTGSTKVKALRFLWFLEISIFR